MAVVGSGADAVRVFRTGALSDGARMTSAAESLGGYRSAFEEKGLLARRKNAIAGLVIEYAAGANGVGVGVLMADSDTVRWTAPGDVAGARVTILDGETAVITSNFTDRYVRVRRTTSAALKGTETVILAETYTNAASAGDVPDALATTGGSRYRALMLRAEQAVPSVSVYLSVLTAMATSDGSHLSAGGAGTIGTTGNFDGWPSRGFAQILAGAVGSTERELIYYSARTRTILTVPATGRAQGGSSAAAGAANDRVRAVPGYRIALETPTLGAVQTIANESTAPTGLTWSRPYASGALSTGALAEAETRGLWVQQIVPAGMIGDPWMPQQIKMEFTTDATLRTKVERARYRVENAALSRLEAYLGVDAEPDYAAAPATTGAAFPLVVSFVADARNNVTVRRRNRWNQISENVDYRSYDIAADGSVRLEPPSGPAHQEAVAVSSGAIRVRAIYNAAQDEHPADTWVVWASEGTDPDPDVDTPAMTEAMDGMLEAALPDSYTDGADVRVLVRTRRTSDTMDSENTEATTATADALNPGRGTGGAFLDDRLVYLPEIPEAPSGTTIIDAGEDLRFDYGDGSVSLYWGAELIWRCVAREGSATTYFPSGWTIREDRAINEAGAATPLEIVSALIGDKRATVNVHGMRLLLIDRTNQQLGYTVRNNVDAWASVPSALPVFGRVPATYFQVWDMLAEGWTSYMRVDADGTWRVKGGVDFSLDQAAIEAI